MTDERRDFTKRILVVVGAAGHWGEYCFGPALQRVLQYRERKGGLQLLLIVIDPAPLAPDQIRRHLGLPEAVELVCIRGDFASPQTLEQLSAILEKNKDRWGTGCSFLTPFAGAEVATALHAAGLSQHPEGDRNIAIDKPRGYTPDEVTVFWTLVNSMFEELLIHPIDHYLGKAWLRYFILLRVDPQWGPRLVGGDLKIVEFNAFENGDIGNRAPYYDNSGALHDMIQGHMVNTIANLAFPIADPTREYVDHIYQRGNASRLRLEGLDSFCVEDVVLGQCTDYGRARGVRDGSKTPTYASVRLSSTADHLVGVNLILNTMKYGRKKDTSIIFHFRNGDRKVIRPEDGYTSKFGPEHNGYESFLDRLLTARQRSKWAPSFSEDHVCATLVQIMKQRFALGGPYAYHMGSWGPEEANRIAHQAGLSGFTYPDVA